MKDVNVIKAIMAETAVYIQYGDANEESMRVDHCDDEYVVLTGEESGDQYYVFYTDVDVVNDTFYTLTKLDVSQFLLAETV